MPSSHRAGRIRPSDRNADDNVEILGASIGVNDVHQEAVRQTTTNKITVDTNLQCATCEDSVQISNKEPSCPPTLQSFAKTSLAE